MKKKMVTIILSTIMSMTLAACGSTNQGSQPATKTTDTPAVQAATPEPQAAAPEKSNEKTEIIFWHSMGGAGGEAIKKMVEDFNAAQQDVTVVEQYQGSYDEAITKLKSSAGSGQGPNIMQLYDIGTRWIIDSGYAVEMQDTMDKNGFDKSQIEPNIAAYYSVKDKLYSMPFNSSTPILYYNKDAFKAAGLDAEKPPKNFDELEAMATAVTKDDMPGMTMRVYSWFFEQYISKQGKAYANNGNGRDEKATAVEFDTNGAGINFFTKIDDLTKKGVNGNLGRDEDAVFNAFFAGKTNIVFGSTASLTKMLTNTEGNFELGTAPLPSLSPGDNGGVSVGGGSLWLMDKGDDHAKDAAWKFIEYVVSPEVQVYWHKATGYFPVTTKAYDLDEMKEQLNSSPLFKIAIDQLHDSKPSDRGALLGVFTEARGIIEANWEEMNASKLTPQQVVDDSSKSINSAIEQYNIAND